MEKALASKIQFDIYLDAMQNERSTKYNLPFLVELQKGTDIEKLKESIKKVISSRKLLSSKLSYDENEKKLYITYDEKKCRA